MRVPSLRNVAAMPPYFHDGSAPTLAQAVKAMGFAQLDRVLTEEQVAGHRRLSRNAHRDLPRPGAVTRGGRKSARARAMRLWPGAVGVLLLLLLLTWLSLRGTDTNAPAYAATLQALDDFALGEASLHRDVLRARAGLLRDYDPLVAAERAMDDAVARLRSYARAKGSTPVRPIAWPRRRHRKRN